MNTPTTALPLAVDMDGTLVYGDTLWEACVKLIAHQPWFVFLLPFWLLKGKAGFKHKVSQHVTLDPAHLPYHPGVVAYLQQQKQAGRSLWLVTAANQQIADSIAAHHGLFAGVLASDANHNLSGSQKAKTLIERFGHKGFVYVANAEVDLKVWQHAAAAVVANAPERLLDQVKAITTIEQEIPRPHTSSLLNRLRRALRIHQWIKNLLVFVPLILSHSWGKLDLVIASVLAYIAFSFSASAIYIINDFVDLEADRAHAHKRHRPFAAGSLPLYWGVILLPILLLAAFVIALNVHASFALVLLGYIALTTIYSFYLKQFALLDVLALTTLYALRIIAGAVATGIGISYWLLTFSIFIFLSLALIKRYSELHNLKQLKSSRQKARGYHVEDLPIIILFGISSGYLAVLVTVLYIHDLQIDALYKHPLWLWPVSMAMMYWISRMWLLAHRGELHEDPVLFALRDRPSYGVVLLIAVCLFMAI